MVGSCATGQRVSVHGGSDAVGRMRRQLLRMHAYASSGGDRTRWILVDDSGEGLGGRKAWTVRR